MAYDHKSTGSRIDAVNVRAKIASVVWIIAVGCAVFLVVGALLVALKANEDNSIRDFFVGGAELLDGPLSRDNGLFAFDGANAATKNVLVNWGIAAAVYLFVGILIRRVLRP